MARRLNRRAQRARKKNIGGVILIAVVALALGAAFLVQNMKRNEAAQWDKDSCPIGGELSLTAVMIDQTDPLSPIQQESLRNELQKIRDEIPVHGRLEIYAVGNTVSKTLTPVFSMCNPGRGKDVSEIDNNKKLVERRWKDAFNKPIEDILEKLLKAPGAKESPIMESIQSITVTAFNKPSSEKAKKRLIIASDMIHYTQQFSLYQPPGDYESLRGRDYFTKMRSHLEDVEVEILMFRRTTGTKVQNEEFINFWRAFFNDQGAIVERIYSISG